MRVEKHNLTVSHHRVYEWLIDERENIFCHPHKIHHNKEMSKNFLGSVGDDFTRRIWEDIIFTRHTCMRKLLAFHFWGHTLSSVTVFFHDLFKLQSNFLQVFRASLSKHLLDKEISLYYKILYTYKFISLFRAIDCV